MGSGVVVVLDVDMEMGRGRGRMEVTPALWVRRSFQSKVGGEAVA